MKPITQYTDVDDFLDDVVEERLKESLGWIEQDIKRLSAREDLPACLKVDLKQYRKLRPALKAVIKYFSVMEL